MGTLSANIDSHKGKLAIFKRNVNYLIIKRLSYFWNFNYNSSLKELRLPVSLNCAKPPPLLPANADFPVSS
jgi:hypothetical protein